MKSLDNIIYVLLIFVFVCFPITMCTRSKVIENRREKEYNELTSLKDRPFVLRDEVLSVSMVNDKGECISHVTNLIDKSREPIEVKVTYAVWNETGEKTVVCYKTLDKFERVGMVAVRDRNTTTFKLGEYHITFDIGNIYIDSITDALNKATSDYKEYVSTRWDNYNNKYNTRRIFRY